jgi:hypothetical protein
VRICLKKKRSVTVAQDFNPSYSGGLLFKTSSGEMFVRPSSQPVAKHSGVCLSSQAMRWSTKCQASLGIKHDPFSKITNTERTGGMVQVVEYLPRKALFARCAKTPTFFAGAGGGTGVWTQTLCLLAWCLSTSPFQSHPHTPPPKKPNSNHFKSYYWCFYK